MDDVTSDNESTNWRESTPLKMALLVLLIVAALIITFFRFKKAQRDLTEYWESKKEALEGILANIEKAKKDKLKLLRLKRLSKLILRMLLIGLLILTNIVYVKTSLPRHSQLPEMLGAITDFNAILVLAISSLVFLRYGSFLELSKMFEVVQDIVLQRVFAKKEGLVETILQANLESKAAILEEIRQTEEAMKANERLFIFPETAVIVTEKN